MIIKELDPCTGGDNKFVAAGRAAEEQLAFYLKRAFERDTGIHVFNGLRFEREDGDAAQMDHLLVHPWGMIIVESKSVVGEVSINEHLEWTRRFPGSSWMGMPSPILQGVRQGDFLRRLLEDNVTRLLTKLLGFQKHFGSLRINVLVAISDRGVIRRPKKPELPEICKADQVPERVRAIVQHLARVNGPLALNPFNYKDVVLDLDPATVQRIAHLFRECHCPLFAPTPRAAASTAATPPAQPVPQGAYAPPPAPHGYPPVAPASPAPMTAAPHGYPPVAPTSPAPATAAPIAVPQAVAPQPCGSPSPPHPIPCCKSCAQQARGRVLYGKYGYYFKCDPCGTNTNINEPCPRCRQRTRLRKDGLTFTLECNACGATFPYHVNPPAPQQ